MKDDLVRMKGCVVDLAQQRVLRGAETLRLTTKETELLRYLVTRPRRTVSRRDLHAEVWGHAEATSSRSADDTVRRLRPKVEVDPDHPDHLHTVHGVGYRFEPLVAVAAPSGRGVFPEEPNDLIGRDDVLQAMDAALARGARWLTLWGPGGAGKTRTLTRWGRSRTTRACFVDASDCWTADELALAVLLALGKSPGPRPHDELESALDEAGELALALDNLEQVAGAAGLVARWIDRHRALVIVGSSRQVLGAPDERGLEVGPLTRAHAVELFVARARAQDPGFDPTVDTAELHGLVDDLDRLPLLLEMAAARAPTLRLGDLRARLAKNLGLLRHRGGPERHATVRTTLDWSWELLSAEDQHAVAALSTFAQHVDAPAAAAVAATGDGRALLDRLHRQSWLTPAGPGTFRLFQTLRDHASRQLELHPEWRSARLRHGEYVLAEVEPAADRARSRGLPEDFRVLAHWRADLELLQQREWRSQPELAARACLALLPLQHLEGQATRLAEFARQADTASLPPSLRARLAAGQAQASFSASELERSRRELEHAAELLRDAGEHARAHRLRARVAVVLMAQGRHQDALAWIDQVLAQAQDEGVDLGDYAASGDRGAVLASLGRLPEACAALRLAADEGRRRGLGRPLAMALANLATALVEAGEEQEALAPFDEALALYRRVEDTGGLVVVLAQLASLLLRRGGPERALALLDEAEALDRASGHGTYRTTVHSLSGWAKHLLGRAAEAQVESDHAVDLALRAGRRDQELEARTLRVRLWTELGRLDDAHLELQQARALAEQSQARHVQRRLEVIEGSLLLQRGQAREALPHLRRVWDGARAARDQRLAAEAALDLGLAHLELGDPAEASRAFDRLLEAARGLDDRRVERQARLGSAVVAALAGDLLRVEELAREAEPAPEREDQGRWALVWTAVRAVASGRPAPHLPAAWPPLERALGRLAHSLEVPSAKAAHRRPSPRN